MKDKKIYKVLIFVLLLCIYFSLFCVAFIELKYDITKVTDILIVFSVVWTLVALLELCVLKIKVLPKTIKIIIYLQWILLALILIPMWIYALCNPGITFQ